MASAVVSGVTYGIRFTIGVNTKRRTMKLKTLSLIGIALTLSFAVPCSAQVAVTGYVGPTFDTSSSSVHAPDFMVMADIGPKEFKGLFSPSDGPVGLVLEPWVEGWGGTFQLGADALYMVNGHVGGVIGVNSNLFGGHYGGVFQLGNLQVRAERHSRGAFEGVVLYNIYLFNKRFYIQPWLVPTSDHTSRVIVGFGYTFKQ